MPPQKKRKGKANDGSKVDVTDVMDAMAAASAPPPKRPLFFVDTQGPALTRQERKARAREKVRTVSLGRTTNGGRRYELDPVVISAVCVVK